MVPGKGQQRVWPPTEQQEVESTTTPVTSSDTTFRQPLPPGIRPRMAVSTMGRPGLAQAAMRLAQIDPRMQGLDPRTRLIIQQHQVKYIVDVFREYNNINSNKDGMQREGCE